MNTAKKLRRWIKKLEGMQTSMQHVLQEIEEEGDSMTAETLPDISGAYAVIWDYKKGGRPIRAGLSEGLEEPHPAEGVSGKGSSPFDDILPWRGMQKYSISDMRQHDADVVVNIPEFYYLAFKDKANHKWIWAISPTEQEGFRLHPGSGRYVGRYHTSKGARSIPDASPLVNTNWNDFRELSQNKGPGWGMMDIVTWSAIQLLYLIEFADFDSRSCLGSGSKDMENWDPVKMGGTDEAKYHTVKASGTANQYRWIEDPFSNVFDWIDGFAGSGEGCRIGMESGLAMEDMPKTGIKLADDGWIKNFGYSKKTPWAFIPSKSEGDPDHVQNYVWSWPEGLYPAYVGGYANDYAYYGFFYMYASYSASYTSGSLGSRLQKT